MLQRNRGFVALMENHGTDKTTNRNDVEGGGVTIFTYVLLVVLALSSHRLLWSAVTVLRASTQTVRHTVHLL